MEYIVGFVVLCVVVYCLYRILKGYRQRSIVHEYQLGLLYKNGKLIQQLEAGVYWLNPKHSSLSIIDARRTSMVVAGQEVASSDNVGLKVSVVVAYSVKDAQKAMHSVQSYITELYTLTQLALREELAKHSADALFETMTSISEALEEKVKQDATSMGLELHSIQIRDLMFANDIKRAFNEVLKARKEGEASLERARGESAALRNLANAAKLLDDNPNLLSLRLVQAIESSKGNSFSLDAKALEAKR